MRHETVEVGSDRRIEIALNMLSGYCDWADREEKLLL